MLKLMNYKNVLFLLVPFVFLGCSDLFDTGHTERVLEEEQLGFHPLEQEVNDSDGTTTVEIQLIAPQRDSDLSISFSIDGESTAVAGQHYEIATSSPVILSAGTSSVDITINLIPDSVEGEVLLILNLDGSDEIETAQNFSKANIYIRG